MAILPRQNAHSIVADGRFTWKSAIFKNIGFCGSKKRARLWRDYGRLWKLPFLNFSWASFAPLGASSTLYFRSIFWLDADKGPKIASENNFRSNAYIYIASIATGPTHVRRFYIYGYQHITGSITTSVCSSLRFSQTFSRPNASDDNSDS